MINKFFLTSAIFLAACSAPSSESSSSESNQKKLLSSDLTTAARQCYVAMMQNIAFEKKLPAGTELGAVDGAMADFFAIASVSAGNTKKIRSGADYNSFATDPEISSAINNGHFRDFVPQCYTMFPAGDPKNPASLPTDKIDRDVLCYAASSWILYDKSSDPVITKAKKIIENYRNSDQYIDALFSRYKINSKEDAASVDATALASTIKYGNPYRVSSLCSEYPQSSN